jgi:hypothetical protein
MKHNELPHEQQKTNLAEPLASNSWSRCTGINFTDFVINGVFQHGVIRIGTLRPLLFLMIISLKGRLTDGLFCRLGCVHGRDAHLYS